MERNGIIFSTLLFILGITSLLLLRGPQETIVEGRFDEGIDPGNGIVYLITRRNGIREILDSAQLSGPGFTLHCKVPRHGDSCRVEFSHNEASLPVLLRPNMTLRLRLSAFAPRVIYLRDPDNEREGDTLDALPYERQMEVLMERAAAILDGKTR